MFVNAKNYYYKNEKGYLMKVAIMQVPYPKKGEALKTLEWQIDELKKIEN